MFCEIVGGKILVGSIEEILFFNFNCISFVLVRIMVLYLLLLSFLMCVGILLCKFWIVRLGFKFSKKVCWCKLLVLMILLRGRLVIVFFECERSVLLMLVCFGMVVIIIFVGFWVFKFLRLCIVKLIFFVKSVWLIFFVKKDLFLVD